MASRLRAQQEAVVEEAADLAAAVQARSAYVSVVGAPVLSTMDLALAGMCILSLSLTHTHMYTYNIYVCVY